MRGRGVSVVLVRSVRVTPRGDAIPLPAWTRLMQRVFKHPRLRHYNRLIALVTPDTPGGVIAFDGNEACGRWLRGGAQERPARGSRVERRWFLRCVDG